MFEFDSSKIPDIEMTKSYLDMYDENFVTYEANGFKFYAPEDESLKVAEDAIYAWIAWYERLAKKS
jgi:hypothetical protein